MKITLLALLLSATCASAFTVAPVSMVATTQATRVKPRHPVYHSYLTAVNSPDTEFEEEVERLVQEQVAKTMKMSRLRDANGKEFAPWMNVSPEEEAKIRQIAREKAAVRRKRQLEEQSVSGSLLRDSTNQELSGTGLKSKIVDGTSVELEWATGSESNTKGFIVKRRPAKTTDFTVLASYESYGPLASKGVDGGVYRYLDENVTPGGWVYRITECEVSGSENDLSQCLVDVTTAAEQRGEVIALAVLGAIAIAAVVAGTLLDPVQ